eukprot:405907-Hanusia_phi.AAC.1
MQKEACGATSTTSKTESAITLSSELHLLPACAEDQHKTARGGMLYLTHTMERLSVRVAKGIPGAVGDDNDPGAGAAGAGAAAAAAADDDDDIVVVDDVDVVVVDDDDVVDVVD